tara:strand:+ start:341 stop:808 length:468 start_codon:yes stop_codon:yes gene_type:complete
MKSDIMKNMSMRIRECAKMVGSGDELARRAGFSRRALETYMKGTSEPSASKLLAISDVSGVSLEWLMRGEGPMMRENLLFDEDKAEEEGGTLAHAAVAVYEALHEAGKLVDPEKFEELTFAMWELDRAYKKETEMDPDDPLVKKVKKLLALSLDQ